jgi:hypothetical protein
MMHQCEREKKVILKVAVLLIAFGPNSNPMTRETWVVYVDERKQHVIRKVGILEWTGKQMNRIIWNIYTY